MSRTLETVEFCRSFKLNFRKRKFTFKIRLAKFRSFRIRRPTVLYLIIMPTKIKGKLSDLRHILTCMGAPLHGSWVGD